MNNQPSGPTDYPKWKYVFIGFALIAAFYVLREHYVHVLGYLPYVLLLACPLMHLFGHGHGRHGHHHHGEAAQDRQNPSATSAKE